jgi:hypothetical protein
MFVVTISGVIIFLVVILKIIGTMLHSVHTARVHPHEEGEASPMSLFE